MGDSIGIKTGTFDIWRCLFFLLSVIISPVLLAHNLHSQTDISELKMSRLTEYLWEGKIDINEYRHLIMEIRNERGKPIRILNMSSNPRRTNDAIDLGFYSELSNSLELLNLTPFNVEFENEKLELETKIEFDLELLRDVTNSDVSTYSLDFRKVTLKMELLAIELRQLNMKRGLSDVSDKELIYKIEQVNNFLKRTYTSGLIDHSRKTYLTETYGLIELMLHVIGRLNPKNIRHGLLQEIFETSRLGETTNNRRLLSEADATSLFLRELLMDLEPLDVQLLNDSLALEKGLELLGSRNTLRNKYYRIVRDEDFRDSDTKQYGEEPIAYFNLTFFVGSDSIFELVSNRRESRLFVYPISSIRESADSVIHYLSNAKNSLTGDKTSLTGLKQPLKTIYRELITPLSLPESTSLNIRTDGFLNDFPFEILIDDKDKYLFETRIVDFENDRDSKEILISPSVTYSQGEFDADLLKLNLLGDETGFLAKQLQAEDNGFGFQLSREESIYHLATHQHMGGFQEPKILVKDNQSINRAELYKFNVIPKAMILSNCSSLAGRSVSGEGNQSFGMKAFEIGAEAIVGSLWSIEDKASSQIMISYYSNLRRGQGSRGSLVSARKKYMAEADEFHQSPFFWASYIHIGRDFRLVMNNHKQSWIYICAILGIISLTILTSKSRIKIVY